MATMKQLLGENLSPEQLGAAQQYSELARQHRGQAEHHKNKMDDHDRSYYQGGKNGLHKDAALTHARLSKQHRELADNYAKLADTHDSTSSLDKHYANVVAGR
jgi:hypothetical protein